MPSVHPCQEPAAFLLSSNSPEFIVCDKYETADSYNLQLAVANKFLQFPKAYRQTARRIIARVDSLSAGCIVVRAIRHLSVN